MIRFEHVGFRYGIGPEILSDVNFILEPGSFHFLTGPSGAGKTSLLNLMFLGRKPTRGIITMFDQNINTLEREKLARIRRRIGVVFQEFRLLPHLSTFDNVALPLRILGQPEKEIRNNVNELLEWVGLGDYKNALPQTLSGGQQQRVAVARALANKPAIILADEPTANLDLKTGEEIIALMKELSRENNVTVITATHDHKMLAASDRIVWIKDGSVDKIQTAAEANIKVGAIR